MKRQETVISANENWNEFHIQFQNITFKIGKVYMSINFNV